MAWQNQATVYVGLGSNLGDRCRSLLRAVDTLDRHPAIQVDTEDGIASLYETSPVGCRVPQYRYLNSALRLVTKLTPIEAVTNLLSLPKTLKRRLINIRIFLAGFLMDRRYYLGLG